jgi:hypothetical protein
VSELLLFLCATEMLTWVTLDINNVGSMSQALYAYRNRSVYDEVEASQWQATQVSTISFMNFLGRILIGIFPDYLYLQSRH